VRRIILIVLMVGSSCLGACQKSLPPLVRGATSGGGGVGYDCQFGSAPASNPKYAQSPEMVERLRHSFPPGSPSDQLRLSLAQQGFTLEGPCPEVPGQAVDPRVRWAQFRRNRNEVVANVYWREGPDGRIIWTFGEVFYTFL
jgi:hypothetical protein